MADLNSVEPLYPSGIVRYTTDVIDDDDPTRRVDALALRVETLEYEVATLIAAAKVEKKS